MMMINLEVDGKRVQAEPGEGILRAARRLDIEIPTLCYH